MKKKWQEVKKCRFAIQVVFGDSDVSFKLYDRNGRCLRHAVGCYPMTDDKYSFYIQEMYGWADRFADNQGEWIYVHNPYHFGCAGIQVG